MTTKEIRYPILRAAPEFEELRTDSGGTAELRLYVDDEGEKESFCVIFYRPVAIPPNTSSFVAHRLRLLFPALKQHYKEVFGDQVGVSLVVESGRPIAIEVKLPLEAALEFVRDLERSEK